MSLSTDITIGTNVYSLTQQRTNSSLRSDASTGIENPNLMTVSHEEASNGRISTVVYLDSEEVIPCNDTCATVPVSDVIRAQFKIQYNPSSGRTGVAAEVERLRVLLLAFIDTPASFAKLLNQET